jgi:elongation factor G
VDLVQRQALVWHEDALDPQVEEIPPAMATAVSAARTALVDAVCEADEALLELWLEGGEPSEEALIAALRRAVIAGHLVPVFCGAALRGIGVQPLLDAVVDYLPAPQDRPCSKELEVPDGGDSATPLRAVAFKLVRDAYVGHLTWVRVFAGQLRPRDRILNPRTGTLERVSRVYRIHAEKREPVECCERGDVVGLVGMKSARTGDTLCDPLHPILLAGFEFPDPVITVALRARVPEEIDKLQQAVLQLCDEDPTLKARFDPETGEQTLAGMGELHLEVTVDRLRSEFGLTPEVSLPQIAYRETVRREATAVATYKRQSGGHGHYAQVRLAVEPLEQGGGLLFENAAPPWRRTEGMTGASRPFIPGEYIRDVELGVRQVLEQGVIAGYPLTDLRVRLLGGRFHEVDSTGMDYRIAGSMAMRQVVRQARPGLLEPVMAVDISTREEYLGTVTADLGRRRGHVLAIGAKGRLRQFGGVAPLAEVRGYATALRNLTQGRATFVLSLKQYDLVPGDISDEVIAQRREAGKVPAR